MQMSGRAGRRGLDKVGNVIISTFGDQRDLPDLSSLHMMLKGKSTKLQVSAFPDMAFAASGSCENGDCIVGSVELDTQGIHGWSGPYA